MKVAPESRRAPNVGQPPVSISVRIQNHPSRAAIAERLQRTLEDFEDVEIVTDPGPANRTDAWRAHRACLEALPDHATHLLVIQDDALPRQDLRPRLFAAVQAHPDQLLLGFVPGFGAERKRFMLARQARATLAPFETASYVPTVCILYPRRLVRELLHWADHGRDVYRRPMRGADDGVLANYFRVKRIRPPALALVPCACDHDESLMPIGKTHRTGPHRRAALL